MIAGDDRREGLHRLQPAEGFDRVVVEPGVVAGKDRDQGGDRFAAAEFSESDDRGRRDVDVLVAQQTHERRDALVSRDVAEHRRDRDLAVGFGDAIQLEKQVRKRAALDRAERVGGGVSPPGVRLIVKSGDQCLDDVFAGVRLEPLDRGFPDPPIGISRELNEQVQGFGVRTLHQDPRAFLPHVRVLVLGIALQGVDEISVVHFSSA